MLRPPSHQVVSALGPDDLIQDWDIADKLWTHALK
jgi:hypothetical protein